MGIEHNSSTEQSYGIKDQAMFITLLGSKPLLMWVLKGSTVHGSVASPAGLD